MTADPAYEALIVDFGGVLTTPLEDAMMSFSQASGIEFADLARAALAAYAGGEDELVTGFETGRIPEAEFEEAFAARLTDLCGTDIEATGLIERIFRELRLEEAMLTAVESYRSAGLKTGLLSNSWGLGLYPRERLAPLFDAVVISGEVGLRKPDPAIFRMATDQLGVAAAACVFVDDHPGHLQAAREAGMTTVLHRSPAQTIAELETLLGPLG